MVIKDGDGKAHCTSSPVSPSPVPITRSHHQVRGASSRIHRADGRLGRDEGPRPWRSALGHGPVIARGTFRACGPFRVKDFLVQQGDALHIVVRAVLPIGARGSIANGERNHFAVIFRHPVSNHLMNELRCLRGRIGAGLPWRAAAAALDESREIAAVMINYGGRRKRELDREMVLLGAAGSNRCVPDVERTLRHGIRRSRGKHRGTLQQRKKKN